MLIRFTPDADAELAEARQWYAPQREGLDLELMECIEDALSRIVRSPHLYPIVYRTLGARLFGVSRSRCFMKLPQMRFM
ncbi:MAG: hypothetical protein WAM70_04815 [Pyrinomonadaceae bacterium]